VVFKSNDPVMTQTLLESYLKKLECIKIDKTRNPIKIALIGEIYSMIEPFSSLFIEEKLMDYGVCTYKMITPSWWLKNLALKPFKLNSFRVQHASKQYLPVGVGGHARESIGHALLSNQRHADGAIQIYPLGCMPEVITKAVLPAIKEKGFPVLSLVIDEATGDAGYTTRIEAFLDMLEMKRKKEFLFG
jgi:predicted nucleotide-binding protein (sugar kinase/HSP70/actin superfamily)